MRWFRCKRDGGFFIFLLIWVLVFFVSLEPGRAGDIQLVDKAAMCNKERAKSVFIKNFNLKNSDKLDIISVEPLVLSLKSGLIVCEVLYILGPKDDKEGPVLKQIFYYGEDFVITGFISREVNGVYEQTTKDRFYIENYDFVRGIISEIRESFSK